MFGWVITCNLDGHDSGFWSPFPNLVTAIHNRVSSPTWDYWGWQAELHFRRTGKFL